ncbi:E3 ubiquitin-protein ligase TRIM21-like [Sphaeramia orbicularis]|uniref:E3 ubiquitin-protein ligase TRIM21-like n=1 Tax=Sphaeramia orbicularis TaxID=375764 RepID=A0A673ABE9_9TELE|nr:E3 ubiquitin-protein ligase TRIM21-like [Sphaeramia orbicularis]
MAAASCLLSEDQFLCSICLDVFTDPVSTPCGHNFCKTCITQHWDVNVPYNCPFCKRLYTTKPELQVNTFIVEMAAQFRQSTQQRARSRSEQQAVTPGEIPCDVCAETKLKAVKSCLVCLASYCETHLEPHLTVPGMRRHQLIEPVENLETRMCTKHDKLLELFCRDDEICICTLCTYSDHKKHEVVPLKDEYEVKKFNLGKTETEIQQMIQNRRLKINKFKQVVEFSNKDADREIADGVKIFTILKESVEKGMSNFIKTIKGKQRITETQAKGLIKELEEEISELMKRSTELQQLSGTADQLHLIQNFSSLNSAPSTKDWTEVRLQPPTYEGTVVRALAQLEETFNKETKSHFKADLKRVETCKVEVTLDPASAHPQLLLSGGGRRVKHGDEETKVPDSPKRFDRLFVLGNNSFSSGRVYYEAQVQGKTEWTLGVARASVSRKGVIPLKPQNGFWTICLKNKFQYFASTNHEVPLFTKCRPEKVGVFVDYEEGLVSFYDVNAATLIYSFTGCSFNEKLHPFCSPGRKLSGNSAPLIMSGSGGLSSWFDELKKRQRELFKLN